MATGLKDRTNQAGNEADDLSPGQKQYDELYPAKKLSEAENDALTDLEDQFNEPSDDEDDYHKGTYINSDGDEQPVNYNANPDEDTSENIKSAKELEESGGEGSSLYSEGSARSGRSKFFGNLKGKMKKAGPTSGIMAVVLGGVAGGSFFLSPAGLFVAIEKNVTNDGADSTRTTNAMRPAYLGGLIGAAKCDGDNSKKLRCKMTTATKQQVKKWRADGFRLVGTKVDADGKPLPGADGREGDLKDGDFKEKTWRAKIKSVTFPNKTTVSKASEFERETKRNLESRRYASRVVNNRASFYLNAKFDKVLKKFGISKNSVSKKEAQVTRENADKLVAEEREKAQGKLGGLTDKAKKSGGVLGFVTGGVGAGCAAYNTARIIVGGIKTKWVADIIAFAMPFVQLGSKIANNGALTPADMELLEDRADALTWYQSPKYTEKLVSAKQQQIDENNPKRGGTINGSSDLPIEEQQKRDSGDDTHNRLVQQQKEIKEKENLSGTDSQGLRMAMYGDTTALKDFTNNYTTGGIASVIAMQKVIDYVQNAAGGKENIRNACITAGRTGMIAGAASLVGCIIAAVTIVGGVICVASAGAQVAAYIAAIYFISKGVEKAIIAAIKNSDFNSDIKGVDAGNALAAGIGLMLAHSSRGNGLKPASNPTQVKKFISATDATYYKYGEELARYEARGEPFNMYNQYSFAGNLAYNLNPYMAGQKTGFSYIANAFSFLSSTFNPTAYALYSQPSLMTNTNENLEHRVKANDKGETLCPDSEMQEAGLLCDWSGRMVGYTSERVLKWADQQTQGTHDRMSETLDFMLNSQSANEGEGAGSGTGDETCNDASASWLGMISGNCRKDSEQPSIKEDGTPNEDSQYAKYVKYCTEDRDLEMGSISEPVETDTQKDQDWYSGKQCGHDSLMMDHFAFYYHMCTVQYATANNTADCTDDADLAEEAIVSDCAGTGTETDTKNIYTCAKKYDDYAYKFNGGRDGNAQDWIKNFNEGNVSKYEPILDASGLVRMAYVEAMNKEAPALEIPNGYANSPLWEAIPLDKAEQGDIVTTNVHVAIVESNDPKKKEFKLFSAQAAGEPLQDNINESTLSYNKVKAAYRAKK